MALKAYLDKLNLFHDLVNEKSTGSVMNLSKMYKVSESTVKRMVKDLEDYKDVKIKFCRKHNSYIIEKT